MFEQCIVGEDFDVGTTNTEFDADNTQESMAAPSNIEIIFPHPWF